MNGGCSKIFIVLMNVCEESICAVHVDFKYLVGIWLLVSDIRGMGKCWMRCISNDVHHHSAQAPRTLVRSLGGRIE